MTKIRTALVLVPLLVGIPLSSAAQGGCPNVVDFVRSIYIEGMPYDAAKKCATEDTQALLAMLHDRADAPYWPNVTMVLGLSGDTRMARRLIMFVHGDGSGDWTSTIYRGRVSGITALGYLVHESKDDHGLAMNYLIDSTEPDAWTGRDIPWLKARMRAGGAEWLPEQLGVSSVMGLTLTGRCRAARALAELRAKKEGVNARVQQVAIALQTDQKAIMAHGLSEYYRER